MVDSYWLILAQNIAGLGLASIGKYSVNISRMGFSHCWRVGAERLDHSSVVQAWVLAGLSMSSRLLVRLGRLLLQLCGSEVTTAPCL